MPETTVCCHRTVKNVTSWSNVIKSFCDTEQALERGAHEVSGVLRRLLLSRFMLFSILDGFDEIASASRCLFYLISPLYVKKFISFEPSHGLWLFPLLGKRKLIHNEFPLPFLHSKLIFCCNCVFYIGFQWQFYYVS